MPDEPKPYRIQTSSGHRKYMTGGAYRPSVTTILSQTESEASKKALATWVRNNPNNDAAVRGTAVHLCCEQYLRGLPVTCPDEYADFWNGMSTYLDYFDNLVWSEGPLRRDWYNLRSPDKQFASVWSTEHNFAGCPDLVAELGGVKCIIDFKTSNAPYRDSFPDRGDRQGFGGWRKYQKVAQQLSAYRLALHERTGYYCDVGVVLVSTPKEAQLIVIDSDRMQISEDKFLKRAQQYHAMHSDEQVDPGPA